MQAEPRAKRPMRLAAGIAAALLVLSPAIAPAADFEDELERIDTALRKNVARVPAATLESCRSRRNAAVRLYAGGEPERAVRRLAFCREVLKIPDKPAVVVAKDEPPPMSQIQAQAALEVEKALALTPNTENGLTIYRECARCHMPEGWGMVSGTVPQIAGQHRKVVIKQLADFRAGNRDNVLMIPYSSVEAIGGAQAVADVAGYIDTLEINVTGGKGKGDDLARGEKLYGENCVSCHGAKGEGDDERFIPRIQAQHYRYLVRQFEEIRDGKRRNSHPEMVSKIQGFEEPEIHAMLDYVSRLEPPEEFQAPPDWRNPDFAN